jgi:hypothetical protein
VFPVRYELSRYIPEYGVLHSHRRENLKSYTKFGSKFLKFPNSTKLPNLFCQFGYSRAVCILCKLQISTVLTFSCHDRAIDAMLLSFNLQYTQNSHQHSPTTSYNMHLFLSRTDLSLWNQDRSVSGATDPRIPYLCA